MMNCKKVFDKEGNVVGMIDSSGKESRLFKAIMGHPAVQSSEDAVSIFKNIYSPKMENVLREIKTNETSQNLSELYLEKNDFDNNGEVKLDSLIEIAQERINIERTSKRDGSWMTAPNGEKTNLNEHQWVSTRTGRFKNWFGDWENKPETASKVVDENGEPLVMYHATRGDFSAFDPLRSFEGVMHFGSILSSNYRASVIDIYKPREGQWKSTIPVFLNIKNIVRTYDFYGRDEITRDILHERSKILQEDIARATEEGQVFSEFIKAEEFIEFADQYTEHGKIENSRDFDLWLEEQKSLTGLEGEALKENIRKRSENLKKYKEQENLEVTESDKIDGAVYTNLIEAPGEVSYVVLDPSNIKSALSNQGTYSESFNNIQKQVSEVSLENELKGIEENLKTKEEKRKAIQEIVKKLQETGLASEVIQENTERLGEILKSLGFSENIRKQISAWHGSPYFFKRFLLSEIGSGEGVQAFGWGLYFTDLEGIARTYAEELANYKIEINGKEIRANNPLFHYQDFIIDSKGDVGALLKKLEKFQEEDRPFIKEGLNDYLFKSRKRAIDYLKGGPKIKVKGDKNLYRVTLHKNKTPLISDEFRVFGNMVVHKDPSKAKGERGSKEPLKRFNTKQEAEAWFKAEEAKAEYKWLEWYKPLPKEAVEKFLDEIQNSLETVNHNIWISDRFDVESFDGGKTWVVGDTTKIGTKEETVSTHNSEKKADEEALRKNILESDLTGKDLYSLLSSKTSPKEASLFLLENGFDGVRYPAESLFRGTTHDNARGFNYVVFEEGAITIEEVIRFKKELFEKGIKLIPSGFVHEGKVYLNTDNVSLDTPIHEFSHLYNSWLKETSPEKYSRGIELVNQELAKEVSEISEVIDFVKRNQPNLEGEALAEEVLAQLIGERGVELLENNADKKTGIVQWLRDAFEAIKELLGLSSMTNRQVMELTLQEYADAVAVDLLSGENVSLVNRLAQDRGVKFVKKSAEKYRADNNMKGRTPSLTGSLNESLSSEISAQYDRILDNSQDPEVVAAYEAMAEETLRQYDHAIENGLKVKKWDKEGEPYKNSREMLKDLEENNSLTFLPNSEAFGQGVELVEKDNIGLRKSGRFLEDGYELTVSEVFRVVHDYFGHGIMGNQFGAVGEENATLQHLSMYSDVAAPAVIFQTRGQNSWVNFSEANRGARQLLEESRTERRKGNTKKAAELLQEFQESFKFAEPKVNIFPNKYNFKNYETARQYERQQRINELGLRNKVENKDLPNALARLYESNGSRRGVTRRGGEGSRDFGQLRNVKYTAEYELSSEINTELKKAFPNFKGVQKIYEITEGEVFRNSMIKALENNKYKSSVTLYSASELSNMRMFMTEDGSTGIVLTPEGFLGGGFSNPSDSRPNNLAQLMIIGIKEGALTAEAFDTILPDYYAAFGFKAVSRTKFSDEMRPLEENGAMADWDYNLYKNFNNGRPDVVFLVYDGGDRATIEQRVGNFDGYNNYYKAEIKERSYEESEKFMQQEAVALGELEAVDRGELSSETADIRFQRANKVQLEKALEDYYRDPTIIEDVKAFRDQKIESRDFENLTEEDSALIEEIYNNYDKAMGRTSDYRGNLEGHLLREGTLVYRPFKSFEDNSALVGHRVGEIFLVSHFAPESIRKGLELIDHASSDSIPIIMAVPQYQANQLNKAGFKEITTIPQYFAGEVVMKKVMANEAVTNSNLMELAEAFGIDMGEISQETADIRFQLEAEELSPTAPEEKLNFKNRANDQVYDSYREALNSEAKEIETGFETPSGEFIPVKTTTNTTDPKTFEGFANSFIKQGVFKDTKRVVDGRTYFEVEGGRPGERRINTMIVQDEALVNLGWQNFKKDKYGFQFQKAEQEKTLPDSQEKAMEGVSEEILSENKVEPLTDKAELPSDKDLKLSLMDFLDSIGVDTMSISDYVAKYRQKHGVDPSAKALADISNSIIAFKNGEVTLESLSEETAHFIVEGWNQGEIENLLRNIHQTPEYQEFASHYREIYSKKYKGEELDQAVRREILGKVLHRAFLENFNSNYAKSDTHRNIIQRLADLFRSFIEKVRSLVSPKHETELRQFTDQVIENLYRGELKQHINTENFTSSPFVLYKSGKESSMLKSAKTETIQALRMLRTNINALRGTVGQSQADKVRIDRQVLELERVEEDLINRQTVNELAAIADSQVNHIRDIIESNTSGAQTSFTSEINSVYEMLKLNLLPTIVRITSNLKNNEAKYPQKEWNDIVSELERVSTNIQQLDPVINALHERNMDAITERIMLKFNLGSWYKDHIKAIVETAQKDTSYFHRHFGQINNSRNPYLGTLSEVIERTYFNSGQESHLNLKKWQIALEEAGYTTQDLKSLVDGSYYVAPQNESLKEDVMNRLSALIRLKVTGDETSTVQDIIKKAEQNELSELTPQQKADYNRILSEMSSQLKEQPWVDQYYKDRNERWENLNISKETQSIISAYSQDRFNILRETRDEDGVNDLTKLSESEREALESIRKRRKNDKSFYNDDGSLKEGIGVVTNIGELNFPKYDFLREQEDSNKAFYFQDPISNMVYYIMDPKYIEGTSARIAMDLNKLDADYINQNKKGITESKELPELFKKGLQAIQTKHENAIYENKGIERESATENQRREVERLAKEEAFQESLEFVELNSTLSFSEKFWEDLNKSDSFEERSRYLIEQLTDKDSRIEASFTWRDLKRRLAQRSAIVRLYKKSNAPHEIDANNLSRSTKDRIKELDDAIASGKNKLNNIFLRELDESAYTEFSSSATSDLNQAYREATKNMTISEELRFALENASERGKQKINDFLSAKRRGSYTSYQKAFIENQEPGVIDKNNPEELVYARSQVASYYKRFAPNELSETLKLKEEATDINTYLESITSSENLQLNPHFSFLEDTSINMKNPKFDSNYKGEWLAKEGNISYQTLRTDESGKLIFKKGPNGEKVLDPNGVPVTETTNESVNFEGTRYKELFGEDGKKNPRLKKIYDVFMEQKQASFDNYGIDGYSNLYLLPQIYQTGLDRALQTAKRASVKGVKQGIEQFFMHREDDIAYGEKVQDFAKDINVIPKYYVNRLKNQEELSREIEWTQALMYQQSVLFKHRKNNIAEALAIKNALENVNRTSSRGKEAKVTMDMFENYLDYAFYGQKETIDFKVNMFGKEVDVTKSARMLLDYVKFRNMGFNSIVSVTSWLTSEVSLRIEKAVGEIMNSDASNMATRKFSQMLTDALKDTGQLHAKSDLMNQMEFFGVYDPLQRLKNPTFKWLPRMLQQVGWGIQQAADFPISPRAMLSVMMDNRVVNGKIMNYNTFKLENPKLTKKQAKEEWRKYANLTVQDFLDISDRTVKFNESIKDLLDDKLVGDKDAYLELTMERLSANVKRVVSQLNQLIPESQKVAAQRHFAMNYLMTHKSWLSIVLSNRTKNGHFNTSTGLWEEGTYRTFFKFAETAIKEMTSKGFIKSLKDTWNGVDIPDDVIGENGEVIPQNELNIPKQMLLTTRRRNMRRMLVDLGWVLGIAGLSYGLMALADNDEDDNYALQMSAYLSLRLLNQVTTMGTAIPNQMVGTLESPFVGLNVVKDMLQMPVNMFNSSIVQQGKFKGDSVRWAELQKTVPGLKTFGDLKNLEHSFDSYYYFNRTNLLWSPAAILDLMYNSGE